MELNKDIILEPTEAKESEIKSTHHLLETSTSIKSLKPTINTQQSKSSIKHPSPIKSNFQNDGLSDFYCESNKAVFIPSLIHSNSPEPTIESRNSNIPSYPSEAVVYQPSVQEETSMFETDITTTTIQRRNRLTIIRESFINLTRISRCLFLYKLIFSLVQLVLCYFILIYTWDDECDSPLRVFLALYIMRLFINLPIVGFQYLNPRRNNRLDLITIWTERSKTLLDIYSMLLFVIGNYLLFTSNFCSQSAPLLFYFVLALVILGYLIICFPIIFCGAIIFCLPCVLVSLRVLRIDDKTSKGATDEIIDKITLLKFKTDKSISDVPITRKEITTLDTISIQKLKFFRWTRYFNMKKKPSKEDLDKLNILFINSQEDANCVICLMDYEDEDLVRQMNCSHHFHKDCLDEWLKLNSSCPLCKFDISKGFKNDEP